MSNERISVLILLLCLFIISDLSGASLPGDANNNNMVEVGDVLYIINYEFRGGPEPVYQTNADVNGDCSIDIADAVVIINYIFRPDAATPESGCSNHDESGDCQLIMDQIPDSSYAYSQVLGNDLYIYHMNAYYQCCLEYQVEYSILPAYPSYPGMITATEHDIGPPCDCICFFNLSSVLYDVPPGEYTVILIDIEGEVVDTAMVTVDLSAGLLTYSHGDCFSKSAMLSPQGVEYFYSGDTLTLWHDNAEFNCNFQLFLRFEQAGDTLRFHEINIASMPASCMCYFEITASVAGIPAGTYVAEIYTEEWGFRELLDRRILQLGN